jgi:pyrimidine-nucleoside phosphorylase
MTGQSERIVPADRKMYALRDVTATVESIPLITASILSKKFAEGAEGLVLDVKAGSGAFMKTRELARQLAESLCRTGRELGQQVRAVITSMEEPLGRMVGNFLEVIETIEVLRGGGPADLREITLRLAAHMLQMGGVAQSIDEGESMAAAALEDGAAWERFCRNVELQGGDPKVVLDPETGPKASVVREVLTDQGGHVNALDAYKTGMASVLLGAGRAKADDPVLPAVGVELLAKGGDRVDAGQRIARVHGESEEIVERAQALVTEAYSIGEDPGPRKSLILEEITN